MLERLTYDDDLHQYRYDGQIVPSVTQVLHRLSADQYRGADPEAMERAALLGKAVHRMIELDLRGQLDTASLSEELGIYFVAWRDFMATSGFVPIRSEQLVYSARYGYAGTLDLFGRLDRFALIDAKRTIAVPRTAGPQTAAYEAALRESLPELTAAEPIDRYALHLRPDGTWRLVPFRDRMDLRVFLAQITTHQWLQAA
jgi:hypothetical protein